MPAGLLNGSDVAVTGNNLIDAMTVGYRWQLDASRTVDWSISNGLNGEFWNEPATAAYYFSRMLSAYSYYANINFNYVGYFSTPPIANGAGSDINVAPDSQYMIGDVWGVGFFPIKNNPDRGDIYININSIANSISYEPGSAGWFFIIHEIGHTLGLKHPHDDGGTGRPTFAQLGWQNLDIDLMTVMSYNDNANFNYTAYDPATPMIFDVLALQYLYGKNYSTNAGDSVYTLTNSPLYLTIWDASGVDTINQASSNQGWYIELPDTQLTTLVDTRAGVAMPVYDYLLINENYSPSSLSWLAGDMENVIGSNFSDYIYGNSLANNITGGGGNDTIMGGGGDDVISCGDGIDTCSFALGLTNYSITNASGVYTVRALSGAEGKDVLTGVEYLAFKDKTISIGDLDTTAPQVTSFSPTDGATGIAVGNNIVLTFNEAVQKGTGTIFLRSGSATGTIVEQFDVATSARITTSGSALTIDPANNLANSTKYFVTFASGTVKDLAGNNYAGITTYDFTTVAPADSTAPLVSTFSPGDGATGVAVGNNIVLTFNETVQKGTGTIFLRSGSATGTIVEQFDVATSARITTSGSALTIDPANNLASSTKYFVTFASGTVKDLANNNYSGTNTYDFTTVVPADTTAPQVTSFSPTDGSTGIAVGNNIVLTFNEAIQKGTGIIHLRSGSASGTIVEQFDAATSTRITASGSTLTIDPTNNLANSTQYFVTFASGTVKDVAGNNYAGITTYDFTTGALVGQTLTGTSAVNTLTGDLGNDIITGLGGTDVLNGGEGSDLYVMTLVADHPAAEINDTGTRGTDEVRFTTTSASTLTLYAGDRGIESVVIGTGNASSAVTTGTTANNINASAVTNALYITGNNGNNSLTGSAFNDTLTGNSGNDILNGGSGVDDINGGKGADTLTGGSGRDTFVFATGDSGQTAITLDKITDYTKGTVGTGDLIDFTSNLTIGGSAATATASQASINMTTGLATFASGSGTFLSDALLDVASRMTAATNTSGEFALFQVNKTGDYYAFFSDGTAGVGANDVLIQLIGVNSYTGIDFTFGNMTII